MRKSSYTGNTEPLCIWNKYSISFMLYMIAGMSKACQF